MQQLYQIPVAVSDAFILDAGWSGLWSLPDSPEKLKKESHFC